MSRIVEKEKPTYEDLILYLEENYEYLEARKFRTDEFYYVACKYLNLEKRANISSYLFEIKNNGESFYYKIRFDRKKDALSIQKLISTKNRKFELLKSFLIKEIYNRHFAIIDIEISLPALSNYEQNSHSLNVETLQDKIYKPPGVKLLKLTKFLFSPKTQRDVFEVMHGDWQEEYFGALFKKDIWKAHWINVRYTYAFLGAIWQKSPVGGLVEFIRKFAK